MALEDNLLIVIDPTADHHPARDRVVELIQLGNAHTPGKITLLLTVDGSNTELSADNPKAFRDTSYVQKVSQPLIDAGVTPDVILSWSKDWADSILLASQQTGATSILISHPRGENQRLSDEFWYLIRNSSALVDIIKTSTRTRSGKVLITMDVQDDDLSDLNKRIFQAASSSAKNFNAELHMVNAYKDSSHYPNRGRILNLTGIDNDKLHITAGDPEQVVINTVKELDPDMIVMGATRRRGIKATLRGRKLSKIIQGIDNDIIIVV
jgi:universal stress protein E